MAPELRGRLVVLRLRPKEPEAMIGRMEDVDFLFVSHPWKGLAMWVTHVSARTAAQCEPFLPRDPSRHEIARAMVDAFESCHPEPREEER